MTDDLTELEQLAMHDAELGRQLCIRLADTCGDAEPQVVVHALAALFANLLLEAEQYVCVAEERAPELMTTDARLLLFVDEIRDWLKLLTERKAQQAAEAKMQEATPPWVTPDSGRRH